MLKFLWLEMAKGFYFLEAKFWDKKPKVSEILGILGFFIPLRKRGEVYRGISFLISQNLYLKVPRVFPKALKSKKFPEVKDE